MKGKRREKIYHFLDFYFLPKKLKELDCFLALLASRACNDSNRCKILACHYLFVDKDISFEML